MNSICVDLKDVIIGDCVQVSIEETIIDAVVIYKESRINETSVSSFVGIINTGEMIRVIVNNK